jgi:hypothetical protein
MTAHDDKVIAEALEAYQRNEMTTGEIAEKFGVCPSTLTVWAENAGLVLRKRGRRMQTEPNARQRAMLDMAQYATYEQVGIRFGCAKQAVQRIVKRWKAWAQPKKPPFAAGDLVLWKGKRYRVADASQNSGTLVNRAGETIHQFRWSQNGKMPKKIG